jgi:hypothetical protein
MIIEELITELQKYDKNLEIVLEKSDMFDIEDLEPINLQRIKILKKTCTQKGHSRYKEPDPNLIKKDKKYRRCYSTMPEITYEVLVITKNV